jgi:hypothetical protein
MPEENCPKIYYKVSIRIRTFSQDGSGSVLKSSGSATLPVTTAGGDTEDERPRENTTWQQSHMTTSDGNSNDITTRLLSENISDRDEIARETSNEDEPRCNICYNP